MLKIFVEFAAYGVAAILAAVCIFVWAWKWSGWSWSVVSRQLRRSVLAVMVVLAVVATIEAQKRSGNEATGVSLPREEPPVGEAALLPLPATNTLHFSTIAVPTSGTVTLTAAWPENFLTAGQTLDILRKEDLRDETWIWLTNGVVEAGSTNMTWTIENQSPSNSFYKAVVRESLTDMDDPDGDGLPNVYELAHGMNPWLNDYAHVQKLTVGPNGEFGDIFSALAESEEYSIIAVTSGTYQVNGGVQMPPHPVMVTCEDGYAVFSGTSPTAMFLLGNGHDSGHTLFRNLYLNLTSTSGMQAGFWCGGGLPWETPGASAVFENVHIRAPNPGVEYLGWLFYAPCDAPAVIRGCCVNASGAEWIYAVFGDNPPPIMVESCAFVNFPTQSVYQSAAIGLRSTYANGAITSTPPVTVSRTLFDDSFTNAWPLVRFENASDFPVTMTGCICPSEPIVPDFMPDVTNDVHVLMSQVAWAGFPLTNSLAAALGIGAFTPLADDPLANMDGDNLSDYNEVYTHGTDPFLADTDNDGTDDGDEILDGTDPSNPHSFIQRLTVTATNTESLAYPVRVAWGYSPTGWETNGVAVFPQGFGTKAYTNEASQVTRYARAFCDFNDDGEYDAGNDILLVRAIPNVGTARIDFAFGDVDGDGLSDYDEIYTHGTDPLSRDTDGDGVHDGDELSEGTDPTNPHSFAQIQYVSVTNTASLAHSVYLAWGYSDTGWETNGLTAFSSGFGDMVYTNASSQGATHIKAFCDLDDNGEYDADNDILIVRSILEGRTAHVSFIFGDVDHDGVPDAQERSEGTDPYDGRNFRLAVTVNLMLCGPSQWLTNYVAWGYSSVGWETNGLASFNGTNHLFVIDEVVSNGFLYVKVFQDLNTNGVCDVDVDAICIKQLKDANNGKTVIFRFDDANNNNLPDWWEAQEGLDAEGVARRMYDDPDGDDLINLHEYWCRTHPLVPDGSNSLLSVTARATNDRLYGTSATNSLCLFDNYFVNGSNGVFQINTNFWAKDVDFSGICVWNSSAQHNERAGALISPRHLLMANHWYPTSTNEVLYFRGKSGCIYSRKPLRWRGVSVPNSVSSYPDTGVVLLNEPLDTNDISVISIFSTNLLSKVGSGYAVPFIYLNRKKEALVKEIKSLTSGAGDPNWHHISFMRPLVTVRQSFVTDVWGIPGDSSSPSFVLIDNKLVVFGMHSRTTSDSPVFLSTQQIQQAMDILAPGYELIIEDLSEFPDIQ